MSGVYGRKVSLLLLMSSLESLLGPAMAVTSAHEEGAAVSQVGRGGAVTEAAVSKSVLDCQCPGLLVNYPGPGGGAEQ